MQVKPTDVIVTYESLENLLDESLAQSMPESADAGEAGEFLNELGRALRLIQAQSRHPDVMIAPDDQVASLLLSLLAEKASENADGLADAGLLVPRDDGFEVKFDHRDIGWVGSLFSWLKKLRGRYPWQEAPVEPVEVGSDLRVAVLGDWGSGRYGAPTCAETIDAAAPAYDVALHLGDVYYAGTGKEVQSNFLDHWPREPALSRACNSNHEMYTGGEAYFEKTVHGFGHPGSSSNFALANDHWLLVGLDTGYEEHTLEPRQVAWLESVLASRDGRSVLFFSHHQPFSAFEKAGGKLRDALAPILEPGVLHAWYWGHEHRCVLYEPHPIYGHGRCAGHSGFPYDRDRLGGHQVAAANPDGSKWYQVPEGEYPKGLVLDGPNPFIADHVDDYGPHGFLSLELQGKMLREVVHAADGTVLRTTEIPRS